MTDETKEPTNLTNANPKGKQIVEMARSVRDKKKAERILTYITGLLEMRDALVFEIQRQQERLEIYNRKIQALENDAFVFDDKGGVLFDDEELKS